MTVSSSLPPLTPTTISTTTPSSPSSSRSSSSRSPLRRTNTTASILLHSPISMITTPNSINTTPISSTSTLTSPRLLTNNSSQTIKPSSSQSHSYSQTFSNSTHHSTSSLSSSSSTCSSPPYSKQQQQPLNLSPIKPFNIHHNRKLKNRFHIPHFKPFITTLTLMIIFYLGYLIGSTSLFNSNHQSLSSIELKSKLNSAKFKLSSLTKSSSNLFKNHEKIPFLINLPISKNLNLISHSTKIPNYLHYVFGMSPDFGEKPFGFIHFAALQSALQILKPTKIFIHYAYRPTGWWFDRVTEIEQVILIKVRDVKEIYGRPVEHFAHKSDIIRLEALRDYGGIYLDFDVFIVRDFKNLLNEEVVLGQEESPSSSTEILGICNAIILSKPFSPFISRWLSTYKSFDKTRWADHSASIPWLLAKKFSNEVTILGPRAFFYPLWHEDDLWKVHKTLDWDFDQSGQLAYHAWSSLSYKNELSKLNPERIHIQGGIEKGENSFTYFVRRFIHKEIIEKWNQDLLSGDFKEL